MGTRGGDAVAVVVDQAPARLYAAGDGNTVCRSASPAPTYRVATGSSYRDDCIVAKSLELLQEEAGS